MAHATAFEAELMKLASERIAHFIDSITNKDAVPTHADYMYLAGNINALRAVLPDLCEEANENLAKR